MKRKCGILTWHYLDNYGSFLQTYALYTMVKKNGLEPIIINYCKDAKTAMLYKILRQTRNVLFASFNKAISRKRKFYKERKHNFKETKLISSYEEIKNIEQFDTYVCGSDQIWSSNLLDMAYFFKGLKNSKFSSYAVSTVIDCYTNLQKDEITKELIKFDYISVREKKGIKLLSKLTNKKIEKVLDPTLLLTASEWMDKISKTNLYGKYILCYLIGEDCKYKNVILNYAKKNNLKLINICIQQNQKFGDLIIENASPFEFLNMIFNAETIFTDSYHGTLFSIIFSKNFYSLKRFEDNEVYNQNERVYEVMHDLKLLDRYVDVNSKLPEQPINYEIVNNILKDARAFSKDYLRKIL